MGIAASEVSFSFSSGQRLSPAGLGPAPGAASLGGCVAVSLLHQADRAEVCATSSLLLLLVVPRRKHQQTLNNHFAWAGGGCRSAFHSANGVPAVFRGGLV